MTGELNFLKISLEWSASWWLGNILLNQDWKWRWCRLRKMISLYAGFICNSYPDTKRLDDMKGVKGMRRLLHMGGSSLRNSSFPQFWAVASHCKVTEESHASSILNYCRHLNPSQQVLYLVGPVSLFAPQPSRGRYERRPCIRTSLNRNVCGRWLPGRLRFPEVPIYVKDEIEGLSNEVAVPFSVKRLSSTSWCQEELYLLVPSLTAL